MAWRELEKLLASTNARHKVPGVRARGALRGPTGAQLSMRALLAPRQSLICNTRDSQQHPFQRRLRAYERSSKFEHVPRPTAVEPDWCSRALTQMATNPSNCGCTYAKSNISIVQCRSSETVETCRCERALRKKAHGVCFPHPWRTGRRGTLSTSSYQHVPQGALLLQILQPQACRLATAQLQPSCMLLAAVCTGTLTRRPAVLHPVKRSNAQPQVVFVGPTCPHVVSWCEGDHLDYQGISAGTKA